jgi:hypothetical protein
MLNPYSPLTRPLAHVAFLTGRTDRRFRRGLRLNPNASMSVRQAYLHGYRGDKFHRLPCGQLCWSRKAGR